MVLDRFQGRRDDLDGVDGLDSRQRLEAADARPALHGGDGKRPHRGQHRQGGDEDQQVGAPSAVAHALATIPMMKKAGFKPHVAGGIEPAASIGGMFMPPIMGAGGFIMAELTGMPYSHIMLVAIFPAIMYVFSVFVMAYVALAQFSVSGAVQS